MARLSNPSEYLHQSNLLSGVTDRLANKLYLSMAALRPSTVVIVNKAINDGAWTEVATGLTGVLSWKLSERSGNAFEYAYVAAPATYMTAYGPLQRDTEITQVYVRKVGGLGDNLTMELETWSP